MCVCVAVGAIRGDFHFFDAYLHSLKFLKQKCICNDKNKVTFNPLLEVKSLPF